jgi:hypothetical protein
MTDAIAKTITADETAMHSVAEAIRDAATTASEHASEHAATKVKRSASEAGPKALETISRITKPGRRDGNAAAASVFVANIAPGILVMLADTDAGTVERSIEGDSNITRPRGYRDLRFIRLGV